MWVYSTCGAHPSLNRKSYNPLFEAGHHLNLWELLGANVLDTTKCRLQVIRLMDGKMGVKGTGLGLQG